MNKSILFALLLVLFSCKKKDKDPKPAEPTPLTSIYHDDFDDNRHHWPLLDNDTAFTNFNKGSLLFTNRKIYHGYVIYQSVPLDANRDFTISGSVAKTSAQDEFGYGLVWGTKATNQYIFLITQTGYCKVDKYENGTTTTILNWTRGMSIKSNGSNVMKVMKKGTDLLFVVNDLQVGKTAFQPFFGDQIGFIVTNNYASISIDYLDVAQ